MNFAFGGKKLLTMFAPHNVKNPHNVESKIVVNGKCNVILLNLNLYKNPIMNPASEIESSVLNFAKTVFRDIINVIVITML